MARETIYMVQGFSSRGEGLKPQKPTAVKSEEAARRAARRLGEEVAGAVAFSTSGDSELGDYDEDPTILLVVGRVPEEFRR